MSLILSHSSALAWWRAFPGSPNDLPAATALQAAGKPCVSPKLQAELASREIHPPYDAIATCRESRSRTTKIRAHVSGFPFEGAVRQTPYRDLFVVSPEACLAQNMPGLPFGKQAELACEFLGTYRASAADATYDAPTLTTKAQVASALALLQGMHGASMLDRVLPYAGEGSASPQESRAFIKLSAPHFRGGLGMRPLLMNHQITLDPKSARLLGKRSCRIDLFLPHLNVGIEYDSYQEHLGKRKHDDDAKRRTVLASMGIPIHVLTYEQLRSPELMRLFARSVYCGTGRKLRIRCKDFEQKQRQLWEQLDGWPRVRP